VKIATFNINGINKRLDNLLAWLDRAQPDVVCLQELKSEQGAFPASALVPPVTVQYGRASSPGTVSRYWRGASIRFRPAQFCRAIPRTARHATLKPR
jgi:exonuclease III